MGIFDFFTLKTSGQLYREDIARKQKARVLATPHGLRSEFGDKQKALDEARSKSEEFLNDIEKHFGRDVKYLNPEYTGRAKYENLEQGYARRMGIRWRSQVMTFSDCFVTDISFSYVETKRGIRVDYIAKFNSGEKEVINDNYDSDRDSIYKTQNNTDDTFRAIRRYEDHHAFITSGHRPPDWFIRELSKREATSA